MTWIVPTKVSLTNHSKHPHRPSPVSVGFAAPRCKPEIIFSPDALAAAVARTATLVGAPAGLLGVIHSGTQAFLEMMVEDGPVFELSGDYAFLADTEQTSLATRVGAGITDLYMNALGYSRN